MRFTKLENYLWGEKAQFRYLLFAAIIMLFAFLDAREIWTQEHRWADIVTGMLYRHDYLHPFLGENDYYDKPLLSYWLIILITKITGALNMWVMRAPSTFAGLLAVWSIYQLGIKLKDKQLGLLAGWLLITTFYFIFWARISSADMLNLAGSLFAIYWYMAKREEGGFFNYAVFFMVLALTSLCKGLIGAVIPLIAVFCDMCLQNSWKKHLRLPLFLALIPAVLVYVAPFIASSNFNDGSYGQNGLYLVYKENVLRYFQPFDHKGPLYTYFLYLPIYLLPWAFFFIPAVVSLIPRFKRMSKDMKWLVLTLLSLFLFFTLSGSRRSYYVLPLVPYAILLTAEWILSGRFSDRKRLWATHLTVCFFALNLLVLAIFPVWYYNQFGVHRFAEQLKHEAVEIAPWQSWQIVMLDAESKLNFYLGLPPTTRNYSMKGERGEQTSEMLEKNWPILINKPAHTIFITRGIYKQALEPFFQGYHVVEMQTDKHIPFAKYSDFDSSVAFIP